ncbi:MAG: DMT family transporter [Ardenticatenales bacterium]|nr:DMT family transporter [Ardenticatenales bacterium]
MDREQAFGVSVTLLSTFCGGLAPIFGKLAYRADVTPYTLVAARTVLAAGILWLFYALFWKRYIAIDRANLLGCIGMGIVNGLGSLLYYAGLSRVDASLAQLMYGLYPVWVFVFLSAAGHPISRLAIARLILAVAGIYFLTHTATASFDLLGAMLMVAAGAAYGWHLVLGQWTLADVDPRTMTLYVLTTMAIVVATARLFIGGPLEPISTDGWVAIVGLAVIPTALARLFLFSGMSRLGGVQASIIGVVELIVAVLFAILLLGERLTPMQSIGAGLVVVSMILIGRETSLEIEDWEAWLFDESFPSQSEST